MEFVKKLAYVLTLVGALNWGLVGLCNFDLVAFVFGPMSALSRLIYIVVGLSAICVACCGCSALCFCKKPADKQMK